MEAQPNVSGTAVLSASVSSSSLSSVPRRGIVSVQARVVTKTRGCAVPRNNTAFGCSSERQSKIRGPGTREEACSLLTRMWSGQLRRGRNTRASAVRAPSWVVATSMPRFRFLQGKGTARRLGSGQMQARHAHLVQRCVSLGVRVVPRTRVSGQGYCDPSTVLVPG
jgi:hypothetical protein